MARKAVIAIVAFLVAGILASAASSRQVPLSVPVSDATPPARREDASNDITVTEKEGAPAVHGEGKMVFHAPNNMFIPPKLPPCIARAC